MALTKAQEDAVDIKLLKHKANFKNDINDALVEIQHLSDKIETLRDNQIRLEQGHLSLAETLKQHSKERTSFNNKIEKKIDEQYNWFISHDESEMKKYTEIIGAIEKLTSTIDKISTATEENTNFVHTFKKYWGRISLISATVIGTIIALYQTYLFLQKNGVVFVIEKVT